MNTLQKLQAHLSAPAKEYAPGFFHESITPVVECADGSTMSVQASQYHYCNPRTDEGPYYAVEVWHCGVVEAWEDYGSGDDPYAYVPIELVVDEIDRRGGFKS